MNQRIAYRGGARQQDRMVADKLASLKKALIYSYQGATAVFDNAKEFRCLINPSKVNVSEDVKVLSIPYKDICLNAPVNPDARKTSDGQVETGIAPGKVIEWKENHTHWLVYDQHLEELAYFRGEIRRCDYEIDIDGSKYWIYFKRGDDKLINWIQKSNDYFNTLNYTAVMYITNNEQTNAFFKRFTVFKINGEPWEVQSVDRLSANGVLIVTLKEWYKNSIAEAAAQVPQPEPEPPAPLSPRIVGETHVYPYSEYTYTIDYYGHLTAGEWSISNDKVKVLQQSDYALKLQVVTSYSGTFTLTYTTKFHTLTLDVTIDSL